MMNGYLTPIVKLISAGSGTEADLWSFYNFTTIAYIVIGIFVTLAGMFL